MLEVTKEILRMNWETLLPEKHIILQVSTSNPTKETSKQEPLAPFPREILLMNKILHQLE